MTQPLKVVHFNPDNPGHIQLKDAMRDIQTRQSKGTLSMWISIENALRYYHLNREYTAVDILIHCYQEGLFLMEDGGSIENPIAWLRVACLRRIKSLKQVQS